MTEGLLVSGVSGTEYFINVRVINAGNLISGIGSSNRITYLSPAEDPDGDGSINRLKSRKSDPLILIFQGNKAYPRGFNLVSFPAESALL